MACVMCPQMCLKVCDILKILQICFEIFLIHVTVSFPCISQAIEVQIFYPGTAMETRDQDLLAPRLMGCHYLSLFMEI